MNFEEQFPSFNRQRGTFQEANGPDEAKIDWHDHEGDLVHVEDVQEFCLDKQKVLEEIDKILAEYYDGSPGQANLKRLKKELEL